MENTRPRPWPAETKRFGKRLSTTKQSANDTPLPSPFSKSAHDEDGGRQALNIYSQVCSARAGVVLQPLTVAVQMVRRNRPAETTLTNGYGDGDQGAGTGERGAGHVDGVQTLGARPVAFVRVEDSALRDRLRIGDFWKEPGKWMGREVGRERKSEEVGRERM